MTARDPFLNTNSIAYWQARAETAEKRLAEYPVWDVIQADLDRKNLEASNWKNVAAQYAQVLHTLAEDERLDPDTRAAIKRTITTAITAHFPAPPETQ